MSEKSIQRLKHKFIITAMLSFVVVMLFMSGFIYLFNVLMTRDEVMEVMDYLVENKGDIITSNQQNSSQTNLPGQKSQDTMESLRELFGVGAGYDSPEFLYSTRYFAVLYDEDGNVTDIKTGHIAAVNEDQAISYANAVRDRQLFRFGTYDDYYYYVDTYDDGSQIVIYLDCTDQLAFNRRIVFVSLILIGAGMIISFFLVRLFAGRIVQPEIRNAEIQKEFITNASHELKTPLAVIRANTELLEMMHGENEWTTSTMRQVERMTALIQNLVMITRAQEKDGKEDRVSTDISKAVKESAETFQPIAEQEGKQLVTDTGEGITMMAQEGEIRQLTSLLVDNAIKYCDDKGTVGVKLEKKGKGCRLQVSNNYAEGKDVDYNRFFDRFYREDQSHNQDRGGFGIGLSIAQELVRHYRGSIDASWENGIITFTCILQG